MIFGGLLKFLCKAQGCHWSGKSQGNSRSGKSQGILFWVREFWNFEKSQGNLKKCSESQGKLTFMSRARWFKGSYDATHW